MGIGDSTPDFRLDVSGTIGGGSSIQTGTPSIGFGSLDIASTDDIGADDTIQSAGGSIEASDSDITAFINGSATLPGDGDGDTGDVNAADDLRAGDQVLAINGLRTVAEAEGHGEREMYADTSTEVLFFDRGRGQLSGGYAYVNLDPIFASSVTVSEYAPLLVQITPTANCRGIYVARADVDGFVVRELGGGTSDATFDWEVAGKRRNQEDFRLRLVDREDKLRSNVEGD